MTWKDRILFGVPAIGAAIPIVIRIVPQLLFVLGVILFVFGVSHLSPLRVGEEDVQNVMPILITMFSLAITLGGFAFKQYSNYKSKQIKFQKEVTDTLFFRNLANNAGVFQYLIDAAEEEKCKEIILVYYHLLTSKASLTAEELDNRIEEWMDNKFGVKIDFDIQDPLSSLSEIRGKVVGDEEHEVALLRRDRHGVCHVLPLDDAKTVIDYVWDNAFRYS